MESSGAAPLQGVTTIDRLLGRQAESDLIALFLAAAAEVGRGLLIVGEAGVGKTALLSAAADAAAAVGTRVPTAAAASRSEEHTSELQSRPHLVCPLLLGKKYILPRSLAL